MGPVNGRNLERVKYFSIKEYLSQIELESHTLDQMEYVNRAFDEYIEKLMNYDDLAIIYFLCYSFEQEMKFSNQIENHIVSPLEINEHNMFFDKMAINHTRIKELHQFVMKKNEKSEYRTSEMKVGSYRPVKEDEPRLDYPIIEKDGEKYYEDIFWYGVEPEDVKTFMDDFITFYKDTSSSLIHSNPFIKSSLAHLIFLRIHPFEDGNGRTARMLHNLKFTDAINRIKGSNLRISPLNVSPAIAKFKNDYNKYIDHIYFDLDHKNNNPEINQFLRFMLISAEDEISFLEDRLEEKREALENISQMKSDDELFGNEIKRMKLQALVPKKY